MLRWLNLSLLVLYPVAWAAPLIHTGLLPLFGLTEISVLTGLRSLWTTDIFLALLVGAFALLAPMVKTIALALVHFGHVGPRALPLLRVIGRLAMADIFLIAVYVTIFKGMGMGRIETGWGLYLFTFCVLMSILIGLLSEQSRRNDVD